MSNRIATTQAEVSKNNIEAKSISMVVQMQLEQVGVPLAWESEDGLSRLYHGDSLEIMASLPAESVDCIWTDPPYNLSNDGITCVSGQMVKVNKGEWDRSRGVEMDHEFNKAWLAACYWHGAGKKNKG